MVDKLRWRNTNLTKTGMYFRRENAVRAQSVTLVV